jgi:hypothetical protein
MTMPFFSRLLCSRRSSQASHRASTILERYFALTRVALGAHHEMSVIERQGWTLRDHAILCRTLGDGCHNLAQIARDGNEAALVHECEWLWAQAQQLRYPAHWDGEDVQFAWCAFWNAVAEPLGRPPRYGVAYKMV